MSILSIFHHQKESLPVEQIFLVDSLFGGEKLTKLTEEQIFLNDSLFGDEKLTKLMEEDFLVDYFFWVEKLTKLIEEDQFFLIDPLFVVKN